MTILLKSPLEHATTEVGFSIVNSLEITKRANQLVLQHISEALKRDFVCLDRAAQAIVNYEFERFKDKPARLLSNNLVEKFLACLYIYNYLNIANGDFLTDEEGLGYGNVYWRIVRTNSTTDVGPIHADKWFWELGETPFPDSHKRVKVWIPLIQDDENPSLMILPGSQRINYSYDSRTDTFGRRKPVFSDSLVTKSMITAPVRVGEAIIFNDSLLHGGKVTGKLRVSLEFTLAVQVKPRPL